MRQLYTSYKRTWRRVAAPEQVLRNGGWDRADEDLGWLTNDDVRSLTSTNKQAPAKGQRVIDVTVYKRMRCSIITRAHSPRSSKVTFSLILAKSSRITIFGKCSTRTPLIETAGRTSNTGFRFFPSYPRPDIKQRATPLPTPYLPTPPLAVSGEVHQGGRSFLSVGFFKNKMPISAVRDGVS